MASKLREVLAHMQKHGVPEGSRDIDDHKKTCLALTLGNSHEMYKHNVQNCAEFFKDKEALDKVLGEQYPEFNFIPEFNDSMARQGRDEDVFRLIEKAIVLREEEI